MSRKSPFASWLCAMLHCFGSYILADLLLGEFPRHHGAARGPAAGRAGGRLRLRARLPALRRGLLHRVRPLPQVRARSVRGGALPRAGAGARGDPSEPTQPRLPPRVGF